MASSNLAMVLSGVSLLVLKSSQPFSLDGDIFFEIFELGEIGAVEQNEAHIEVSVHQLIFLASVGFEAVYRDCWVGGVYPPSCENCSDRGSEEERRAGE